MSSPIIGWRYGYRGTFHVLWRTPQRLHSSHLGLQFSIQYLGVRIIFEGARASRHSISQAYILFDLKYIWQSLEMTSRTQPHPQILLSSTPWVTTHNIIYSSNTAIKYTILHIFASLHHYITPRHQIQYFVPNYQLLYLIQYVPYYYYFKIFNLSFPRPWIAIPHRSTFSF